MRLDRMRAGPLSALQYLERYVNEGSPSGFTLINRTSADTDPFGDTLSFYLNVLFAPQEWFTWFGALPTWIELLIGGGHDWLLIHPDMAGDDALAHRHIRCEPADAFRVIPTSSSRTVQVDQPFPPDYIKLHYNRILGRINRSMPMSKLLAGLEVSEALVAAIADQTMHPKLAVFPETGGGILNIPTNDGNVEWGMAWRPFSALTPPAPAGTILAPFFALFSADRLNPRDSPLLCQLVERSGAEPLGFAITQIVEPIISIFVSLICEAGFQPEWNAQNVLVAIDDSFAIRNIVMRDMADVEKDLTIRRALGLNDNFASYPYKCISERDGASYKIRHSFAFDFKLGKYILDPIAKLVAFEYAIELGVVQDAFRACAKPILKRLPSDFFPSDGLTYEHDRILLTGDRPYTRGGPPTYR
jgi:hypothetical protein